MLPRVLEPELMDDADEASSYDAMDHSAVNSAFVADLLAGGSVGETVLDLGTGTAQIPIVLCTAESNCRILALDAAISMLEIARQNVMASGFADRIQLEHADAKGIKWNDAPFDCVISNSLMHHLPDPQVAITELLRVLKEGGRVFVRDLIRPESAEEVERLVSLYAADEPAYNQQLLRQSFHAALTLEEAQEIVVGKGFAANSVRLSSDRHWTWDAVKPMMADL